MEILEGPDPLCRFYSQPHIGDLLVQAMPEVDVGSIIDLGAGGGVLSDAASRRWSKAAVTTVDIDADCAVARRALDTSGRRRHYVLDALDPDISAKVTRAGLFDAALCNPPFKKVEWRNGYERLLEEAGLEDSFSCQGDVTAEALFLAQNIRIVRPGGCIGLIVPDSFASGMKASKLRNNLARSHAISAVIQLPKGSFLRTEANSYLLVFENKVPPGSKIRLHRFTVEQGLSHPIEIDAELAERRLDYVFHSVEHTARQTTLRTLAAQIFRGSLSAKEGRAAEHFVFHTTDFANAEDGVFDGPDTPVTGQSALPGDILLARVDRDLESKIAMVRTGGFAVSDCVYVIRVAPQYRERVYRALRSASGREKLRSASRGLGARQLSKAELLAVPLY